MQHDRESLQRERLRGGQKSIEATFLSNNRLLVIWTVHHFEGVRLSWATFQHVSLKLEKTVKKIWLYDYLPTECNKMRRLGFCSNLTLYQPGPNLLPWKKVWWVSVIANRGSSVSFGHVTKLFCSDWSTCFWWEQFDRTSLCCVCPVLYSASWQVEWNICKPIAHYAQSSPDLVMHDSGILTPLESRWADSSTPMFDMGAYLPCWWQSYSTIDAIIGKGFHLSQGFVIVIYSLWKQLFSPD